MVEVLVCAVAIVAIVGIVYGRRVRARINREGVQLDTEPPNDDKPDDGGE